MQRAARESAPYFVDATKRPFVTPGCRSVRPQSGKALSSLRTRLAYHGRDASGVERGVRCELCEREVPRTTEHHLRPKSVARRRGQKIAELPTAELCPPCHRQLHVLFPNQELATRLDSLERLRANEQVARFLRWLRKQPGEKGVRVRR